MINVEFPLELFQALNQYYDTEWEAMLRPTPGECFEWRYIVFDGDTCINCPILWQSATTVRVQGFEVQIQGGQVFKSIGLHLNINMINGDSLSLDHFQIPRSIYGYKPPVLE